MVPRQIEATYAPFRPLVAVLAFLRGRSGQKGGGEMSGLFDEAEGEADPLASWDRPIDPETEARHNAEMAAEHQVGMADRDRERLAALKRELWNDERQHREDTGLTAAPARGQVLGRRMKLSVEVELEIAAALAAGEEGKPLARKHRVPARTIPRIKRRHAQQMLPINLGNA